MSESDAMVRERILPQFAERGYGLWAVEVPGKEQFIGFVGLQAPAFEADFTPCVEIGWRLAFDAWGRGYATEAAAAGARLRLRGGRPRRDRVVHAPRRIVARSR